MGMSPGGGMGGDGSQISPQSMSQGDMGDALLMMLIGGGIGGVGGAAAGGATGATGAGAIGAEGVGAAAGGSAAAASPGIMDMLFPTPQTSMSSQLGVQDPTMAGILDTIQKLQASPLHSGGVPSAGGPMQIPQGGVMNPQRRTAGRMF